MDAIAGLDKQVDVLLSCKPLPESQIKILCDKVSIWDRNELEFGIAKPAKEASGSRVGKRDKLDYGADRPLLDLSGGIGLTELITNWLICGIGEGNPDQRVQRAAGARPRDHLR